MTTGTHVRYIGWLPAHVAPFIGVVVLRCGVSVLVDVGGRRVWCDSKNLEVVP